MAFAKVSKKYFSGLIGTCIYVRGSAKASPVNHRSTLGLWHRKFARLVSLDLDSQVFR